ncbi:MAG: hypothetical protein E6Y10_00475, partial [Anaerococcus sp.]|nr:hypothetical protein [Anaerococcus sp.]
VKAKPSEIVNKTIILEAKDSRLKLSQLNTKIRLVAGDEGNVIGEKDNTSYKVQINNGDNPNLTLNITPSNIEINSQ